MLDTAAFAGIIGGAVVLWVLLGSKGPTRLVRRLTFAYVVLAVVALAVAVGAREALLVGGTGLAFGLGGMTAGLLSFRLPMPRILRPAEPHECPARSAAEVQRRTDEALQGGWRWIGDRASAFRAMGNEGRAFQRYFLGPDGRRWMYVHAHSSGPMVGTYVACLGEDGRCVRVSNAMDDFVLLPTPDTRAACLSKNATLAELVAGLDEECRRHGVLPRSVDDPVAAQSEVHDRWVRALLADGRFRESRGWVGPTLRSLPGVIGRQLRTWL